MPCLRVGMRERRYKPDQRHRLLLRARRSRPNEPGAEEEGSKVPSVMNALVDALSAFGIRHIDMPATPERVWRAIRNAHAT